MMVKFVVSRADFGILELKNLMNELGTVSRAKKDTQTLIAASRLQCTGATGKVQSVDKSS
jgi:hypothetical protein